MPITARHVNYMSINCYVFPINQSAEVEVVKLITLHLSFIKQVGAVDLGAVTCCASETNCAKV